MTGKLRDLTVNRDGTQNVTVTVTSDFSRTYDALKDHEVSVEIKRKTNGRSKDANSFCWALCADIGKALKPPLPKEDVYRMAIQAVGVFTPVTLATWDVPTVQRRWSERGTGWFAEVVDDAGAGHKLVHMYYGSSTYSVDEMKALLEWLVGEAEQMELPIPLSKKEEAELLERWGKR